MPAPKPTTRALTPADDERILHLYTKKLLSVRQIAKNLGAVDCTVRRRLIKMGAIARRDKFNLSYNRIKNALLDIPVLEQRRIYRLVGLELELIGKSAFKA